MLAKNAVVLLLAWAIVSCAPAVAGMNGGIGGMPKKDSKEGMYEIHVTIAWSDGYLRQQVIKDIIYSKTPSVTDSDLDYLQSTSGCGRKPSIIDVTVKGKWEKGELKPYLPT